MLPAKRNRELTKKQSIFLDSLFDNGGNVIQAMDSAGYHVGSRSNLMHSVKHEIIERARNQLAGSTVKSINRLAEALDADAFEHFKETGIFNKELTESFRSNILEKGNTEPPMEMYVKFRVKEPDPDALLRRDQLTK